MDAQAKLYWHFCRVDNEGTPRLGYGDGREVIVGKTLTVEGAPVLCSVGLHASAQVWDALRYVGGEMLVLCHVTLGGEIVDGDDKSVATERTVIAMLDADATDKLLRDFARWCALQVIHLWDAPDIVRQYLETGDESLRDAAWAAARAATWAAARDAAWADARDAAWADARAAARDAARADARDAARDAARADARDAARADARDAAWIAALQKYTGELERRALAAMERTNA